MPEPLSSSPQRTVTHPTREARGGAEGRRTTMDPVTVSIINIADAERIALPANVYLFNYKANGAVANNNNKPQSAQQPPQQQQQQQQQQPPAPVNKAALNAGDASKQNSGNANAAGGASKPKDASRNGDKQQAGTQQPQQQQQQASQVQQQQQAPQQQQQPKPRRNNKNRSNNHTDQPSGQQQLTENVKKEGLVNGTS